MWKLFPNTWLERAGVFKHRHAGAAEALERNWLDWLTEGLRRVNPRILESGNSDPIKALRELSGRGLLSLDEKLRANSVHQPHRPSSPSPPSGQDRGDDLFADAYLFVAACSPSGFIRERALDAFAHYAGRLAFAAGLIRSTDWVAQVRTAAIALVRRIAPQLSPSDMVGFLELAVCLKDRVRIDEQLWQMCIEHRLQASECREALWIARRLREEIEREQALSGPDNASHKERSMAIVAESRRVFIVHGRDGEMREAVARFLTDIGFDPIILHEQANGGGTVIEKFEAHSEPAGFALVLLSPDDEGRLKGSDVLALRARQNVILELGYFVGRLGRSRVCALQRGNLEVPSDIVGVVFETYDDAGAWRQVIARELQAAGYEIDWNRVMRR